MGYIPIPCDCECNAKIIIAPCEETLRPIHTVRFAFVTNGLFGFIVEIVPNYHLHSISYHTFAVIKMSQSQSHHVNGAFKHEWRDQFLLKFMMTVNSTAISYILFSFATQFSRDVRMAALCKQDLVGGAVAPQKQNHWCVSATNFIQRSERNYLLWRMN